VRPRSGSHLSFSLIPKSIQDYQIVAFSRTLSPQLMAIVPNILRPGHFHITSSSTRGPPQPGLTFLYTKTPSTQLLHPRRQPKRGAAH
jgi:hypothetical protein